MHVACVLILRITPCAYHVQTCSSSSSTRVIGLSCCVTAENMYSFMGLVGPLDIPGSSQEPQVLLRHQHLHADTYLFHIYVFKYMLSHTRCHIHVVTYMLSHTCCHIHVVTYMLSHTRCHIHVVIYMLSHTRCHIHAVTFMLSHTCCHIHAVTYMLSYTCYHTHAVTYMLSHTCCNIRA